MPALFAYLLSITVLVGAGFAGLVWLTEPPPAKPLIVASAHSRPNFKPEVASADDASQRDSVVSTSEPVSTPEPAARAPTAAPQSQAAVASVRQAKPEQPVQEATPEARQNLREDWSEGEDVADRADRVVPIPASRHQPLSGAKLAATTEHEPPARGQGTPALAPKPMLLPKPVLSPKAANAVAAWFGAAAPRRTPDRDRVNRWH